MIGPPRRSLPPKKQIFHNSLFYCGRPGPCDSTILKIKALTNQKSGVQIGYRKSLEICGELNLYITIVIVRTRYIGHLLTLHGFSSKILSLRQFKHTKEQSIIEEERRNFSDNS